MSPKNKGFTLIELMLAIVIYGIVMVTVLGAFWNLVQTRERADHFRNLQKELHFVMVRLADKVRAHSVDYDRTPSFTCPANNFSACDTAKKFWTLKAGEREGQWLEFKEDSDFATPGRDESLSESNVLIDGVPLLSSKVRLNSAGNNYFKFYPAANPFSNLAESQAQIQPRVEIFLSIQDTTYPDLQLSVRTTVSSRRYGE